MNKKIKNRIVFYTMLLVLFVIVNIVVSFAYLRGKANNNESVSTIAIKGVGEINVTYSSNTPNIVVEDILPGYETVKKFSVTSNISSGGTLYKRGIWYQIKLIVDTNGFLSRSLVYSLSLDDNSSTDGITALPVDKISIPNGANSDGILIGTGYFSSDNVSHIYNLKINYVNMEEVDQSSDYQKRFAARVVIDNPQYINLTFDLDGGSFENLKLNSNSTMKVAANSVIDFPVPVKDNYDFIGWEDVSGNTTTNDNIIITNNNDITLKALWAKPYEFDYTGGEQQFIAQYSGYYKIEAWGAQGAGAVSKGGYTSGELFLQENEKLYVYVGQGNNNVGNGTSFNSGTGNYGGTPGGGATDIRLIDGEWNNIISLRSRIMVAGGSGSGSGNSTIYAGAGGGLHGYAGGGTLGGTQTSFGAVQVSSYTVSSFGVANGGCAGGNGYYPGGGATCTSGAGGGSSYISGHTGCVAIESDASTTARTGTDGASCTTGTTDNQCSIHYSGKVFTDTVMIDGKGYAWTNTQGALEQMPNPSGGYYASGVGHAGNGYARITFLHS